MNVRRLPRPAVELHIYLGELAKQSGNGVAAELRRVKRRRRKAAERILNLLRRNGARFPERLASQHIRKY